jgi:hypothetical protein
MPCAEHCQLTTDHFLPGGGCGELHTTCARSDRRSLREKNLARTKSQAIHKRTHRQASRIASRTRPAQHLGTDPARRVLEIRRAAQNRRRKTRLVYPERKQFFHAARKREIKRSRVDRRQKIVGPRAPSDACGNRECVAYAAKPKAVVPTLRRGLS